MRTDLDLIDTYFARAAAPDVDAYVQLFTPGAVVEDEGRLHRGPDAIRVWRGAVATVAYELLDTSVDDTTTTARVRITGDFPGSPVVLLFRFGCADDGRIASLSIVPAATS